MSLGALQDFKFPYSTTESYLTIVVENEIILYTKLLKIKKKKSIYVKMVRLPLFQVQFVKLRKTNMT